MYDDARGGQVCDGIIVSDDATILMEYKGSTFTAKSKYGNDIELLRKELEEKLIGTEFRSKGIRQLANAALSLFSRDGARKIRGLDLSRTTRVIPLLITRDDIGSSFGTNAYLNLKFRSLLGKQRKKLTKTITPLFCVSADDIEKVSNNLSDTSLTRILESRYEGDRGLMLTLFTGNNRVLDQLDLCRPAIHLNANEEFKKEMIRILGIKIPPDAQSSST
jgi:hypothetical protein